MCLESAPSICDWVSMMYGGQFFIYGSQTRECFFSFKSTETMHVATKVKNVLIFLKGTC